MSASIILMFPVACALTSYSIRKVIYVADQKHLFDEPTESRKIHKTSTPNLGGVAIFATMLGASFLLLPNYHMEGMRYICACALLLFFMGLTDDLVGMNPYKKMGFEVIVALLMTLAADVRITSLQGFMGIGMLPYPVSVGLTTVFILLLINAVNLIDGINCLAGSIGLLNCVIFGLQFWQLREYAYVFICVTMCGCLAGFLYHNRTPARIFMGDTGSLFLGFVLSLLSIRFVEINATTPHTLLTSPTAGSGIAVALSLLIIPIYDTLRVFFLRIKKGKSPFHADRNHIHHLLLDLGLSHMQATSTLVLVNIAAFGIALATIRLSLEFQLLFLLAFVLVMNRILVMALSRQRARSGKEKPAFTTTVVPASNTAASNVA